jgi:hypothetical protein
MNESEAAQFGTFLQSLDGLSDLTLSYNLTQQLFLSGDFGASVKFRLNRFFVNMNPPPHRPSTRATEIAYDNLCNFIDKQRSTLRNLTIQHSDVPTERLEFFMAMNLTRLCLVACELERTRSISVKNSSIKELFLSCDTDLDSSEEEFLCDVILSCEEVNSLHFTCTDIPFEVCLAIRNHPSKIKKIKMFRCAFFPMSIPSLKILEISSPIEHEESVYLVRLNPQLKELHVPACLRHFPKFNAAVEEFELDSLVIT